MRASRRNPDHKGTLVDCRARIADRDEAEDKVQDVDDGEQSVGAIRRTLEARRKLRADIKYALPIPHVSLALASWSDY